MPTLRSILLAWSVLSVLQAINVPKANTAAARTCNDRREVNTREVWMKSNNGGKYKRSMNEKWQRRYLQEKYEWKVTREIITREVWMKSDKGDNYKRSLNEKWQGR